MSKPGFSESYFTAHAPVMLSMNKPVVTNDNKVPGVEKRIADPSSSQPNGLSYPIPSFFEYRAKPKEYDSL